ncbi:MAG: EamA family transporter, partial [Treponema sp.]|nr:EamA family transporter [Treponema sp.]
KTILSLLTNANLYRGGGLYVLSMLLNIYILRFLKYSIVLPLTSLTYIWTMFLSYGILKEKIGIKKIIGVLGILIGALLITNAREKFPGP